MKLNPLKALFVLPMLCCIGYTHAQTTQEQAVPKAVTEAFAVKYPKGKFKKWKADHGNYAGTFNMEGETYAVVYDQNGKWVNTSSKIKWTWKLPAAVKNGLKNSKYATWDVNGIKKIESSAGLVYELWVDDSNLQRDAFHDSVFTKNILVDFNPDGKIGKEKDVSGKTLF